MNSDGMVNSLDLDQWLVSAGAITNCPEQQYYYGDTNLDCVVDGSDFGAWNANKFTTPGASLWSSGDLNADGVVDGSDFGRWNANKFRGPPRPTLVPEPLGGAMVLVVLVAVRRRSVGAL